MHSDTKAVFKVGDPIQPKLGLARLGKVTRIFPGDQIWIQVQLIGASSTAIFWPEDLHVCKCVARIPEGVSQCQKTIIKEL